MSERFHRRKEQARAQVRGRAQRAIASRHVFGYLAGKTDERHATSQEQTRRLRKRLDQDRG